MFRPTILAFVLLAAVLLSGCELLGIESPEQIAAQREAEGKAIGGACRQAGRGIEDCFVLNKRADKAAVYAGWREMDDYMRENKLEAVPPTLSAATRAEPGADEVKPSSDAKVKPRAKRDS
jgi:hypothetical protein